MSARLTSKTCSSVPTWWLSLQAPLSGAQRKQELLGGHMKGKEGACTSEARGLGMRHQQKPRLAVRIAGLLQKIISGNLAKPPTSLAGALQPR